MNSGSTAGKDFRNKLGDFLKIYGQQAGGFNANPTKPKTIEIPSYLAAMRALKVAPINLTAGKK